MALQLGGSGDQIERLGARDPGRDAVVGDGREVVEQGAQAVYRQVRRGALRLGFLPGRRRRSRRRDDGRAFGVVRLVIVER